MPIAKGSKSQIIWKEETIYGQTPSGSYNQFPINSETLDENINTVLPDDIRFDRATPAVRGGNIATGGTIIHDFGLTRCLPFFRHLLAAGNNTAGVLETPTVMAPSSTVARGTLIKNTANDVYMCTLGGTLGAGLAPGDLLTVQSGRQQIPAATAGKFLEFEYTGPSTLLQYEHILTAGIDFPVGGICVEKQIAGMSAPFFLVHRGGRMNTLELAIVQEAVTKATWSLLTANTVESATTVGGTPSLLPEDPVTGYGCYVALNDPDGINMKCFRECNITITNNIPEDVYCIGERFREELPEGTRRISGTITPYFTDLAEYHYFKNETKIAMKLSFVQGGEYLEIDLPEVKLTGSGSPKISGQGVITLPMEFTAFKQSSAYDIRVRAINNTQNLAQ